jgi:methionyl-tRNA formyltransferase
MARLNGFEENRLSQLRVSLRNFETELGMTTKEMLERLDRGEIELNGTFAIWRSYADTVALLEKKQAGR